MRLPARLLLLCAFLCCASASFPPEDSRVLHHKTIEPGDANWVVNADGTKSKNDLVGISFLGFCKTHQYDLGDGFGWQKIVAHYMTFSDPARDNGLPDPTFADGKNDGTPTNADIDAANLTASDTSPLTLHLAFVCGMCDFLENKTLTAMDPDEAGVKKLLDFQGAVIYICFIFFFSAALPATIKKFKRDTKTSAGGMLSSGAMDGEDEDEDDEGDDENEELDEALEDDGKKPVGKNKKKKKKGKKKKGQKAKKGEKEEEEEEEEEEEDDDEGGSIFSSGGDDDDGDDENKLEAMVQDWMADRAPKPLRLFISNVVPSFSLNCLGFALIFSIAAFFQQFKQEGRRATGYCFFHFILAMPFYPPVLLPLIKLMIKMVKTIEDHAYPPAPPVEPIPDDGTLGDDPEYPKYKEIEDKKFQAREAFKALQRRVETLKDNAGLLFIIFAVGGYSIPTWMFFSPAAIIAAPISILGVVNLAVWTSIIVVGANLVYAATIAVFHYALVFSEKLKALTGKKARRVKRLQARLDEEFFWLKNWHDHSQWKYIFVSIWGVPYFFMKLPGVVLGCLTGNRRGWGLAGFHDLPYSTIVSLGFSISFGVLAFYIGFILLALYVTNIYPADLSETDSWETFEDTVQDLYGRIKGSDMVPPAQEVWNDLFYQKVDFGMAFTMPSFEGLFKFFEFDFDFEAKLDVFFFDFSTFLGYFAFALDFSVEMVFEPILDASFNVDRFDAKQFMQVKNLIKLVKNRVEKLWIRESGQQFPICRIDEGGMRRPQHPIQIKTVKERLQNKKNVTKLAKKMITDKKWTAEVQATCSELKAGKDLKDGLTKKTALVLDAAKEMVNHRKAYTPDPGCTNLFGLLTKEITEAEHPEKIKHYREELVKKMDEEYAQNLELLEKQSAEAEEFITEEEVLGTLQLDVRNYNSGTFGLLRNVFRKLNAVRAKNAAGMLAVCGIGSAGNALDPKAFFTDEQIKEMEKTPGKLEGQMEAELDLKIESSWITVTSLITAWLHRADAMAIYQFARFKNLPKDGLNKPKLSAEKTLLRKAVRSELRKTEIYSEMLFEFGIGAKDFKANAASGLIGKLDMQDKGSEGDADVEEEDVEQLDDADAAAALKARPVEKIKTHSGLTRKKKHSRNHKNMCEITVAHNTIKQDWKSATCVELTWKAPTHKEKGHKDIEPVRYEVKYQSTGSEQTTESDGRTLEKLESQDDGTGLKTVVVHDEQKGDGKVSVQLTDVVGGHKTKVQIYAIWKDAGKEHQGKLKKSDVCVITKPRTWAPSFLSSQPGAEDIGVPAPPTPVPPPFTASLFGRRRAAPAPAPAEAPVGATDLEAALDETAEADKKEESKDGK